MARDWIDYWTLGAYWAAAAGTWVAIGAAIAVGRWAKKTYMAQTTALGLTRAQLQIAEDQLADARAKDHQQKQLTRIQNGPYFVPDDVIIKEIPGKGMSVVEVYFYERSACSLATIDAFETDAKAPRQMRTKMNRTLFTLTYEASEEEISTRKEINVLLFFTTVNGYEDAHRFTLQIGTTRWRRTEPQLVQLHNIEFNL